MKRKSILFFNILLILFSIILIIFLIEHKKNYVVEQPFIFVGEENDKIIIPKKIQLNYLDIIIIFSLISIILFSLMNIFKNKKNIRLIIYNLILSLIISFFIVFISNKYILRQNKNYINKQYNSHIVSHKGTIEYDSNKNINGEKIVGKQKDINSVLIKNGSSVNIDNSYIYKYGDTSELLSSNIYGINSAILVIRDSHLNINNSTINTFAVGSNGLYSLFDNSEINANSLIINTSDKDSVGVAASLNGKINGENITIKTSSTSSSAISSIRNAKINIKGSVLKTTAEASPLISMSSEVILSDSIGDANNSVAVYITSNPVLKISNCEFNVTANKINEKSSDGAFVLDNDFLNSDYKDSSKINIFSSKINIKKQSKVFNKAPLFSISNTNSVINVSDNTFNYGSNIFLNAKNSNKDKNMLVVLNSEKQEINGNIIISNNISLEMNFKSTNFYGIINKDNKNSKVTINIDKNSTLEITGDSYINVLNDDDSTYSNIISNGYNIYYDKKLNESLNGEVIKLNDGGSIKPI